MKTPPRKAKSVALSRLSPGSPSTRKIAKPADSKKGLKIGKRTPNFTKEEDQILCRAWISASTNPIKGTDMKKDTFWKDVETRFVALLENEEGAEVHLLRTTDALRGRWHRHISPTLQEFTGLYSRCKFPPQSGKNEEDYLKDANDKWVEQNKKPFCFEHCREILWEIPKFKPMSSGENKQFEETEYQIETIESSDMKRSAYNQLSSHSTIKRPVGQKKAKAMSMAEKLGRKNPPISVEVVGTMEMADSIKRNAAAQIDANRITSHHNDERTLLTMVDKYIQLGMPDQAKRTMEKLEKLRDQANLLKVQSVEPHRQSESPSAASMPSAEASPVSASSTPFDPAAATCPPFTLLLEKFNSEDEHNDDSDTKEYNDSDTKEYNEFAV